MIINSLHILLNPDGINYFPSNKSQLMRIVCQDQEQSVLFVFWVFNYLFLLTKIKKKYK